MKTNISRVFDKLAAARLELKANLCTLCSRTVNYLERVIFTDPKKNNVIRKSKLCEIG